MAPPLSYNDWLKYNVLDVFKASRISVASFIRDIVQFRGEFEAKHADLIAELSVLDNTGSIFSMRLPDMHTVCRNLGAGQNRLPRK